MPGILRSSNDVKSPSESQEFDRSQVLKNTELNSQLGIEGQKIREHLNLQTQLQDDSETKKKYPKTKAPTALKESELSDSEGFTNSREATHPGVGFNEQDIVAWDSQRGQTEKITEPNTPYMGTAKDTEYYDADPVPDDLDLGSHA